MISTIFDFKTKSFKNLEFKQTIGSIIIDIRKVKGCLGIDLQQYDLDKNHFKLRLSWQSRDLIIEFLESSEYEFLEGAIRVLCETLTIEIFNGQQTKISNLDMNKMDNVKENMLSELKHKL